uniref:ABC transporter permease n=1 Tax=Agrobacterium fabrum TaxID=1176649 RepID=UPI003D7C2965
MQAPLSVPAVVFALGAYLAFARVGLVDTAIGIIIAHTVLIFPVVYLIASATYSSIDPRLSLAAASLGVNPLAFFRPVVFPFLLPGLAIGALIAVLLSFDDRWHRSFLVTFRSRHCRENCGKGSASTQVQNPPPFPRFPRRDVRLYRRRHRGHAVAQESRWRSDHDWSFGPSAEET